MIKYPPGPPSPTIIFRISFKNRVRDKNRVRVKNRIRYRVRIGLVESI